MMSPSITSSGKVAMSTASKQYKTLKLTVPKPFVYHVELNRPDKLNAFNRDLWTEIEDCFTSLNSDEDCRVVVLSAAGNFSLPGWISLA
ncbi:hypothetical protein GE061_010198 [Apolygus lucorum]|uniref:3-hydroxyisobutyryl-CoA hydrolase n=1 Tax=Apolygus lucorum TaxID=248454 RepID=A0A8S9Y6I2_APOLU|nr:hypothetical protein GE061_010198 [Apolygus lucorum]